LLRRKRRAWEDLSLKSDSGREMVEREAKPSEGKTARREKGGQVAVVGSGLVTSWPGRFFDTSNLKKKGT